MAHTFIGYISSAIPVVYCLYFFFIIIRLVSIKWKVFDGVARQQCYTYTLPYSCQTNYKPISFRVNDSQWTFPSWRKCGYAAFIFKAGLKAAHRTFIIDGLSSFRFIFSSCDFQTKSNHTKHQCVNEPISYLKYFIHS